jgi:probable HAF family extracellular repeat protein
MKTRIATIAGIGIALTLALPSRPHATSALLIELDPRPGTLASAISANNLVVVGGMSGGGGFYWTPTRGVIFNGGLVAEGVSGDGSRIVGIAQDHGGIAQAAIWIARTEWQLLGSFSPTATPCGTSLSSAYDVSRDGQVIVGFAYDGCALAHAFRWTAANGMVDLGSSVQGRSSLAGGVSGDGHVVVGYQESATGPRQGARWLDGREELIPGADGSVGQARAANVDGSIVVGQICHPAALDDQNAWIWTAQGGTKCLPAPAKIPSPGPAILVQANATSDDGQVIGGAQNVAGSPDSNAVIWIGGRPAYLKDFLRANGVPNAFATYVNTGEITGMTPDGHILVGWGAAAAGFRGYIVVLGSSLVIP